MLDMMKSFIEGSGTIGRQRHIVDAALPQNTLGAGLVTQAAYKPTNHPFRARRQTNDFSTDFRHHEMNAIFHNQGWSHIVWRDHFFPKLPRKGYSFS
ncbi:MAG: hypothetical protein JKY51_00590 [Opitutaceae bacterium]|nr:hypothetical protein [Opitutaceae bacterium]